MASNDIGPTAKAHWRRFAMAFPDAKPLSPLYESKNGFVAFESAFCCLPINRTSFCPGLSDFRHSPPWQDDLQSPAHAGLVFATNGIGEIFVMKQSKVLHVDLTAEDILSQWSDLESFCLDILSDYKLHTGYSLIQSWQAENGTLPIGSVLFPKTPFVLGGEYCSTNLIRRPLLYAVQFNYDLGRQLRGLKDGDSVEMKVIP